MACRLGPPRRSGPIAGHGAHLQPPYPALRSHKQVHSHENYLGDRDSAAFVSFIEEMMPNPAQPQLAAPKSDASEEHTLHGEVWASVVPRLAPFSPWPRQPSSIPTKPPTGLLRRAAS